MEQSRIEDEIQSALDGTTYELPEDPLASRLEKLIQELIDKGGGGGGTTITVDSVLSLTSKNPVQNKVITEALNDLQDSVDNLTEIPDMGTDDANDIFNFARASGNSTKYQIGIYKEDASNTPDSTKDWLIISFIGPAPDYISDQIALTYGGTEKPEIYLRAHASGTWTDWGKISSDIPLNSKDDDGIVPKVGNEKLDSSLSYYNKNAFKTWGVDENGNPGWIYPKSISINSGSFFPPILEKMRRSMEFWDVTNGSVSLTITKKDGTQYNSSGILAHMTNQTSAIEYWWPCNYEAEWVGIWYRQRYYLDAPIDRVPYTEWKPLIDQVEVNLNTGTEDGLVQKGSDGNNGNAWVLDENNEPQWGFSKKLKMFDINESSNPGEMINEFYGSIQSRYSAKIPGATEYSGDCIVINLNQDYDDMYKRCRLILDYHNVEYDDTNMPKSNGGAVYFQFEIPDPYDPEGSVLLSEPKRLAYSSDIDAAISNLINGAPETLDTLKELADAIADNQDVVDALNDAIANKVDKVEGKGLSTNDYTDADKAAANTQVDWNVTSTSSPAYILHKPDRVTKTEMGFVPNPDGPDTKNMVFGTDYYGNPSWQKLPENSWNENGIVPKPDISANPYNPNASNDAFKSWTLPSKLDTQDPKWAYPLAMGIMSYEYDLKNVSFPGTISAVRRVDSYELGITDGSSTIKNGIILIMHTNTQIFEIWIPEKGGESLGIHYRAGDLVNAETENETVNFSDWHKLNISEDLSKYLPLEGGKIATDGMELEIDGFGITGNGAQDITNFDVISAMNIKGDKIYYNNQDTDERYIKADSIPINTSTVSGAVLAGADNPNKLWGTDQNGNPGWITLPSSDISIEEDPVNNLDDFVEGNEFKLGKFSNTTGNTPSSKPCLVMSFSSENGSYQLALDVVQNVFVRRQFGYGDTSWLPWDQVNMDRVESEATPNNLITKAHVRVGRYLSETDGDHWNAEEFPTANFGGFIISFGNIDDSNNGMQYAISDDQNKYYRTASVTSTGTYTFGDWTAIPAGSTVDDNTAEKAGIVAAGNTADSKSAVWGLDNDWNPIWKRLQELMIVDGTTPLTTEVNRVRFIKRYRWAVGLDTDETSTKTCYVLDLGADTESNQINFIFDYDYDLLENRGVYARYPIKDSDGDWAMSPPVKLAFSSDVVSLISEAVTELEGKIDLKADIDSPVLTGTPTAPTPEDSDNSTRIATTAFVKTLINALVNGAPETLDTLKELADAIAENETVVEALNAAIGNKVDKVEGKGLSTNDFTNLDKSRVDGAVLLDQMMSNGLMVDPNQADKFLTLINGWSNDLVNAPSFIKNTFALLISSWIWKEEFGSLIKNHVQFLACPNGMAYRERGDETTWTEWRIFDKRDYLPLNGGTLSGNVIIEKTPEFIVLDCHRIINFDKEHNDSSVIAVSTEFRNNDNKNVTMELVLNNYRNDVLSVSSYVIEGSYYGRGIVSLGDEHTKWKELYATNGTIQTSDRNEKNSLVELSVEKAEALIYGSKPTTYMMNSGSSGRIHWGMISQDLEELLEKLGWTSLDFAGFIKSPKMTDPVFDDETGKIIKESEVIEGEYLYSLRYDEFIAPIIKVEQSHNERIKKLETKIEQQETEIADLKSQIEELKKLILGGGN